VTQSTITQTEALAQVQKALLELSKYTAIIFLADGRACSGVFVNTCGLSGILTAYHVAKPLLESPKFALCIAEHPHSLWLESQHLEHIPIGRMSDNADERKNGPDLSFIVIRDANVVSRK
jgi:hypothetical protein